MRIAICDDCREDVEQIKSLLQGHNVKIYFQPEALLTEIEEKQVHFDLYLLDIYLEDSMSGIALAQKIRVQDEDAVFCFVSSSNEFYREAYDLYAVQYLLKPVCKEEVDQLLKRVAGKLVRDKDQSLTFKWKSRTGRIPYGKILYITSRGHTLFIHCKDGTIQECNGKLDEMEDRLSGNVFCRCHQSFLVNLYQAENLNGKELIVSGHRIPISRRYYEQVKERYRENLLEEVE